MSNAKQLSVGAVALLIATGCAHQGAGAASGLGAPPQPAQGAAGADQSPFHGDLSALLARPEPPADNPGSLWDEAAYRGHLDYDQTAQGVGDLVTIEIVEETQASRSASTNLRRSAEQNAGVSAVFGLETKLANVAPDISPTAGLGTDSSSAFDGEGATSRSGSLRATVTARVVGVLANGNLVVMGRQEVKVNHELQVLTIRGIIRPQDIRIDNTIPSTQVADAQIEYTGNGVVAEKQVPGWGSRVVDRVWPF